MSRSTKSKCLVATTLALVISGFAYYAGGRLEADAHNSKNIFDSRVHASQAPTVPSLLRDIQIISSTTDRQCVDDDLLLAKVLKSAGGGILAGSAVVLVGLFFSWSN